MKLKSKKLKHISFNCKTSFCNDNDLKTEMLCECDHVLANCSFELESVDIISTLLVDAFTFFDSNTENTKYYRTMIVLATKRIFCFYGFHLCHLHVKIDNYMSNLLQST